MNNKQLAQKANSIRKSIIEVCVANGAGHIAPSLSCVDILTVLYYKFLNLDKNDWQNRDRLVFSKAHGCYGLYSILADKNIIPQEYWLNFYKNSPLTGCVERHEEFGLEAGCGSLGHGLPMAVGIAFGAKLQAKDFHTYCIVGDGEMQEGTCWEALNFASKHKLSNLTLIVDNNKLQAMDFTDNVIDGDLGEKIKAFGSKTYNCNGHNIKELIKIFSKKTNQPKAIIANTVKGYGLKCMENVAKFHFRLPTEVELKEGNRYE